MDPTCFLATDCSTSRCSLSPIILELSRSILTASLWNTVLYCTVLYCTVLYCTVLYCTVLYCTVLQVRFCLDFTACGCGYHSKLYVRPTRLRLSQVAESCA